jgi:L-amino acid N-acyltransferase YncA
MISEMRAYIGTLRPAERRDAEQIASLYAPIVRDTFISFETEPPSADIMANRIDAIQQRYPWLVAVRGEAILGYAYASEHRQRAAYRWSVDVTAYVAESARRQGVGRQLYTALIAMLRAQGFHAAFAGIALPNPASVALHEAVGFVPVGVYKEVGFKSGAWRDVGWWGLAIATAAEPPAEPEDFARWRKRSVFSRFLE